MPCSIRKISAALAAIALFSTAIALAESDSSSGISSGIKNLAESLDLITAIKAGKGTVDAIALQTALNDILDLSAEEVKSMERELKSLDLADEDWAATRTNYLSQLAGLRARIEAMRADMNTDAKTKDIVRAAQALKIWRDGTYTPKIQLMVDFLAVMKGKKAITTAHARLISIAKEEKKIRGFLTGGKTAHFLKLLKKAQGEIAQATQMSIKAEELLDAPESQREGDLIGALTADAGELIDAAYGDFLAMSRLVNK